MTIKDLIPWRREESQELVQRQEGHPLQTFQRDMNRLFDEFFRGFGIMPSSLFGERWGAFSPRVDMSESDTEIKISAELPGIDEQDIDLSLSHNVLTISGEKREEEERKDENCYCVERSYGSFRRSISLPTGVDADKVEATYRNGVLTITLPKAEVSARKKISVKTD